MFERLHEVDHNVVERGLGDVGLVVLLGPLQDLQQCWHLAPEVTLYSGLPCRSTFASVPTHLALGGHLVIEDLSVQAVSCNDAQWTCFERSSQVCGLCVVARPLSGLGGRVALRDQWSASLNLRSLTARGLKCVDAIQEARDMPAVALAVASEGSSEASGHLAVSSMAAGVTAPSSS